jgi:hypothetical protein
MSKESDEEIGLNTDNIGTKNRPLVLNRHLEGKGMSQPTSSKADHLFRLEFDKATGIPATWVDTKTLNFLNTLRDNIFASSSTLDAVPQPAAQAEDKKKKKVEPIAPVDKESVAFKRGKRSCTLADVKNYKPVSIIN